MVIDGRGRVSRLTSTPTELQAGIIVGALEEEGIQATMSGVYTAGFRAEAPGWVEVLVAEDDLPRAQILLDQARRERTDIDWSQVDVGEREDEGLSDSVPWWTSFKFWRPVAITLTAIYLISVAADFLAGVFGGLLRIGGVSP